MTPGEGIILVVCLVALLGLWLVVDAAFDPDYREARRAYHAPCDQCGHQYRLHYATPTTVGCAYFGREENCGCGIFVGETSRRV